MNTLIRLMLPLVFAIPLGATADNWKDKGGKGKHQKHERREYRQEYWDGNCKIELKMKKNGDFKEKRKCKGARHADYREPVRYVQAPPTASVYVAPDVRTPRIAVQAEPARVSPPSRIVEVVTPAPVAPYSNIDPIKHR